MRIYTIVCCGLLFIQGAFNATTVDEVEQLINDGASDRQISSAVKSLDQNSLEKLTKSTPILGADLLVKAIKNNLKDTVNDLLQKDIDPNQKTYPSTSPLNEATKLFVQKEASKQTDQKNTAKGIIQLLLEFGADPAMEGVNAYQEADKISDQKAKNTIRNDFSFYSLAKKIKTQSFRYSKSEFAKDLKALTIRNTYKRISVKTEKELVQKDMNLLEYALFMQQTNPRLTVDDTLYAVKTILENTNNAGTSNRQNEKALRYAAINKDIFEAVLNATVDIATYKDSYGFSLLSSIIYNSINTAYLPNAIELFLTKIPETQRATYINMSSIGDGHTALSILVEKIGTTNNSVEQQNLIKAIKKIMPLNPDTTSTKMATALATITDSTLRKNVQDILNQNRTLSGAFDAIQQDFAIEAIKGEINALPADQIDTVNPTINKTLLMLAAQKGNDAAVKFLLTKNAKVDVTVSIAEEKDPVTALYFAITALNTPENSIKLNDYARIINTLIVYGASNYAALAQKLSAGEAKTKIDKIVAFSNFVKDLISNQQNATKSLKTDVYNNKLDESLDYNASQPGQARVIKNNTPLIITLNLIKDYYNANNSSLPSILKNILTDLLKKVNADTRNGKDELPIIHAVFNSQIFTMVLEKMSPDAAKAFNADGKNNSILQLIVSTDSYKVDEQIKALFDKANFEDTAKALEYVNHPNQQGKTAIMLLLKRADKFYSTGNTNNLTAAITLLKDKGASFTQKDNDGNSADSIIASIGNKSLKDSISGLASGNRSKKGSLTVDKFIELLEGNDQKAINTYITLELTGPNINLLSSAGTTPLMAAIIAGNKEAIEKLLNRADIDVTVQNKVKESALTAAISSYQKNTDSAKEASIINIIFLLIKHGLMPTQKDMNALESTNMPTAHGEEFALIAEAYLVSLFMSNNITQFDKEFKKYETLINDMPLTITFIEGKTKKISTRGNLLQLLLYSIKAKNNQKTMVDELIKILHSLMIKSKDAKTGKYVLMTDASTGKHMLAYAAFNQEIFDALIAPLNDIDMIDAQDNNGNSILYQVIEQSPPANLQKNVMKIKSKVATFIFEEIANKLNRNGENALDVLIKRANDYAKEASKHVQQEFGILLQYFKDAGVHTTEHTNINIAKISDDQFKNEIALILKTAPGEIPTHITGSSSSADLINALQQLEATLIKIRAVL